MSVENITKQVLEVLSWPENTGKHWKILENNESSSRKIYKERLGRTKQSKSKVGLKMLESVEDAREEWVFVQRKCLIRCVKT